MSIEFVFFTLPLFVVWLIVLLDIALRGDLGGWAKAGWIAAVTMLWPVMILYLLLRPVEGRLRSEAAVRRRRPDAHQRLVVAVLDHGAGLISDGDYRITKEELRGDSPG